MKKLSKLFVMMLLLELMASAASASDDISSLSCTSNAKASRDYIFRDYSDDIQKGWNPDKKKVFSIGTKLSPVEETLRDKVFSKLDTDTPTIRSLTPGADGEEFQGTVISRTGDAIFLVWNNNPFGNKLWSAAIDLTHKKAVISQVYQGATSVGVDSETLDCR